MHQYRNIACHVRNSIQRRKCDCDCVPKKLCTYSIINSDFLNLRRVNMDKLTVTLSMNAIRTTTPQHIRRLLNIGSLFTLDVVQAMHEFQ